MYASIGQTNAAYWLENGNALYSSGKYNESILAYNEAIKLDPKSDWAWNNKSSALISLGKYEEAIQAYDRAIELDPQYAMAWNNKGSALYT